MPFRKQGSLKKLILRDKERIYAKYRTLNKQLTQLANESDYSRGSNIRLQQITMLVYTKMMNDIPMESGTLLRGARLNYYKAPGRKYAIGSSKIHFVGDAKDYVRFVEFGTGAEGEADPHERPPSGWVYNQSDKEKWVFQSKTRATTIGRNKTSNWFSTSGQAPRAFVYKAYLYAKDLIGTDRLNRSLFSVRFSTKDKTPFIEIRKKQYYS